MFESVTAKSVGGAIIGVLALLVLYALIMWAYIASRKRFSGAKYAVELFYIALVFLFSFVIKCAIFSANQSDTLDKGLATIFYSIYSSIGGLEFEGLSSPEEVGGVLVQWLYSGSSVLAGLVFFSIILTRISYEMYSGVLLFFLRLRLKTDTNTDIYLFTSVTQDSLLLANSINKKRLDDKESYKDDLREYTYDEVRLLAELEHERWNRSYIAGGWTFNQKMPVKKHEGETDADFKKRRKNAKDAGKDRYEHVCLLPFSMLDETYNDYDIVNVARVFQTE